MLNFFEDERVALLAHPKSLERMKLGEGGERVERRGLGGGETVKVGEAELLVVHTPGHTDGSLSLFSRETRHAS